ncbi:hypothetical protein [Campylobacter sputorum]|nr:hypothetical protein [Campylobacter sputorum]
MSSLKASLDSGEYNDENELDEVIIDKKILKKLVIVALYIKLI